MKIITVCIFFSAFLLLRPYFMQQTGLRYYGDDCSYFAHSSSLAFGQFPCYKNEYFVDGKNMPLHSIGPGVMASPFVFLFSILDRINGSDIILQRTSENTTNSWSLYGFVFASSFYFWLACFLLHKALRYTFAPHIASFSIVFIILCQGIPLYVFRRPIYSNVYELFLQSFFIFMLIKSNIDYELKWKKYIPVILGMAAGLLSLVRHNDTPMALCWPPIILYKEILQSRKQFYRKLLISYLVLVIIIFLFKYLPTYINQSKDGYNPTWLFMIDSVKFFFARIFHILFYTDWGLIYTAPFMVMGFISAFCFKFNIKNRLIIILLPALINFYIAIVGRTQGGWYGYRYFLTSVSPLLVYPFAMLLDKFQRRYGNRNLYIVFGIIAIFPILSMIGFEGNSSNLTLWLDQGGCWRNDTYQLEVWKTLLVNPIEFIQVALKGGTLYFVYLISLLCHCTNKLPIVVAEKYSLFRLDIFIKTMIIYLFPFAMYYLSVIFERKRA